MNLFLATSRDNPTGGAVRRDKLAAEPSYSPLHRHAECGVGYRVRGEARTPTSVATSRLGEGHWWIPFATRMNDFSRQRSERRNPMTDIDKLEEAAATLEASGNYRILRRLCPRERYCDDDGTQKRIGVVLDVETTGLDPTHDEIIELGMAKFEFTSDGRIYRVLDTFSGLRQPSKSIPREITELTGITDEMVAGQTIDPAIVTGFIDPAAVIIAHNAAFDRKFCERFSDCFATRAWGCSWSQIDWREQGYEGARLGYLLMGAGLFHDGHRAVEDCRALLAVLAMPLLQSGEPALKRLLDTARKATIRILAEGSPFETKDLLKARGYRWNPGDDGTRKCWWRELSEDVAEVELAWLRKEIYRREVNIPTRRITAVDRFSERA